MCCARDEGLERAAMFVCDINVNPRWCLALAFVVQRVLDLCIQLFFSLLSTCDSRYPLSCNYVNLRFYLEHELTRLTSLGTRLGLVRYATRLQTVQQ